MKTNCKQFLQVLVMIAIVFGTIANASAQKKKKKPAKEDESKTEIKTGPQINWFNGTQAAFRDSATKWKKPSFIYIYIDTWDACKGFKSNVLADTGMIRYIDSNFVAFRINMEFTPNDAMAFMIDEVPAVILFNKSGAEIDRMQGYNGPADFKKFLAKDVKKK